MPSLIKRSQLFFKLCKMLFNWMPKSCVDREKCKINQNTVLKTVQRMYYIVIFKCQSSNPSSFLEPTVGSKGEEKTLAVITHRNTQIDYFLGSCSQLAKLQRKCTLSYTPWYLISQTSRLKTGPDRPSHHSSLHARHNEELA